VFSFRYSISVISNAKVHYVVIGTLLQALNYQDDYRCQVTAAEILTVGVVAARYFHNHHERALCVMIRLGDIPFISVSRFNRCLHTLADWLEGMLHVLGDLMTHKGHIVCAG
jgi:hypothetical protein